MRPLSGQIPIIPATHSLLDPGALRDAVARAYPIAPPTSCTLYRAYANDVYFVATPADIYMLKVYRTG